MSHYAIIKRQRYWVSPEWAESKSDMSFLRIDKIKYEDDYYKYTSRKYINLIYNENVKGLLVDFWEGEVNQEVLNEGEKLIINNESFVIKNVEKHTDGKVTYQVDDLYENVESYDALLLECEVKYKEYSEQRKLEAKEYQRLKDEERSIPTYTEQQNSKKSWFKRIFG